MDRGCSVFTRPSIISGKPVWSPTSRHRHAGVAKLLGRAAGREDLDAVRGQRLAELDEPGLVGNGDEGSCDADEIGGHDGGILRKAVAEVQVWGGFFSRRSAHLITVESDTVSPVTTT